MFFFNSGEIDELKQDLSSFRFEVLNTLQTQQNALQDAITLLSAKVDLLTRAQQVQGTPSPKRGDYDHSPGSGYQRSPLSRDYDRSPEMGQPWKLSPREGHNPDSGLMTEEDLYRLPSHSITPTMELEAPLMTEHEPAILSKGIVHEYHGESVDTALRDEAGPEIPIYIPPYPAQGTNDAATIGVSSSTTSDTQTHGRGYRRDKRASVIDANGKRGRMPVDDGSSDTRSYKGQDGSSPRSGTQTPKSPHSPSSPSSQSQWERPTYKQDMDKFINLLENSSSTS